MKIINYLIILLIIIIGLTLFLGNDKTKNEHFTIRPDIILKNNHNIESDRVTKDKSNNDSLYCHDLISTGNLSQEEYDKWIDVTNPNPRIDCMDLYPSMINGQSHYTICEECGGDKSNKFRFKLINQPKLLSTPPPTPPPGDFISAPQQQQQQQQQQQPTPFGLEPIPIPTCDTNLCKDKIDQIETDSVCDKKMGPNTKSDVISTKNKHHNPKLYSNLPKSICDHKKFNEFCLEKNKNKNNSFEIIDGFKQIKDNNIPMRNTLQRYFNNSKICQENNNDNGELTNHEFMWDNCYETCFNKTGKNRRYLLY